MNEFSITSRSREDTARAAAALAPALRPGDALMLKGTLAGGKTAFVQELVAALGSEANVTSPTFTLAQFYKTKAGTVLHVDAYRLSSVAEFRDLGLEDYYSESITAVEWGDIVEGDFPRALSVLFEFTNEGETGRRLTFSASDARWTAVLEELRVTLGERLKV